MKRIRGGSGLGDSIYLRPIVEHLIAGGNKITALSFFPDVFVGSGAGVEPFSKSRATVTAHYSGARFNLATTQYQDMVNAAGIKVPVPLCFRWDIRNRALIDGLRQSAAGRRIIVVHGGREPFGRIDGFGARLMPQRAAFEVALAAIEGCYTVRVGNAEQYPLPVDVDLNGRTSVSDLLDIGRECDGFLAQCSYAVPLAEVFDKPFLGIWSARGLMPRYPADLIASITPGKILSKPSSRFVLDDWHADRVADEVRRALLVEEFACAS